MFGRNIYGWFDWEKKRNFQHDIFPFFAFVSRLEVCVFNGEWERREKRERKREGICRRRRGSGFHAAA
jgi:hypothetical protein